MTDLSYLESVNSFPRIIQVVHEMHLFGGVVGFVVLRLRVGLASLK
jgi:hypothetical protein